jgi:hypothetical protein
VIEKQKKFKGVEVGEVTWRCKKRCMATISGQRRSCGGPRMITEIGEEKSQRVNERDSRLMP